MVADSRRSEMEPRQVVEPPRAHRKVLALAVSPRMNFLPFAVDTDSIRRPVPARRLDQPKSENMMIIIYNLWACVFLNYPMHMIRNKDKSK